MIELMSKSPANNPQPLILAVSGGVDSVVMFDLLRRQYKNLVVAHFEHGIRGSDSKEDARFVRQLAQRFKLPYEIMSGELGPMASEDQARQARYQFLRMVAQEHQGLICTAHHADDVLESIVINLKRGNGWRGLAPMSAKDIYRPLLKWTKAEILKYALDHKLKWREDATNQQPIYLRNQIRIQLEDLPPAQKELLYELFEKQVRAAQAIDQILCRAVNPTAEYQRYGFIMADELIAVELLNFLVKYHTKVSLLKPQLSRAILIIKTAHPGETHQLAAGASLVFKTSSFIVKTDKK